MRRSVVIAVAAGIAALVSVPAPARAVHDTRAFSRLQAELEHRRDNDFLETLDKLGKRQQKAVTKSLARLAKPADDEVDDAITALACTGFLQPVYGDEFIVMTKVESLGNVLPSLCDVLASSADAVRTNLAASAAALTGSAKTKAEKALTKSATAIAAALDTSLVLRRRMAKLVQGVKLNASAKRIIDKAASAGGAGTRATVDSAPWVAEVSQSEYSTGDGALQIFGRRTLGDGTKETIYLVVRGVTGPGTYPLTAQDAKGNFQVLTPSFQYTEYPLDAGSGSVVVQTLSTGATKRVKATFSYTATHSSLGTKTITNGTHDVSGGEVDVRTGNGF